MRFLHLPPPHVIAVFQKVSGNLSVSSRHRGFCCPQSILEHTRWVLKVRPQLGLSIFSTYTGPITSGPVPGDRASPVPSGVAGIVCQGP